MDNSSLPVFDSMLGGSEEVPSSLNLLQFVNARKEEILMLTEAIEESPFKGQLFQRLPKHMRRRQMSHNIKRLPRKHQRGHLTQSSKTCESALTKRPSRKYRRRPSNLHEEYGKRQQNGVWLETHVWHAKRFHMTTRWGYKLPLRPVNKAWRAGYRAATQHCLLLDVSHHGCLELRGAQPLLLGGLQRCVSPAVGLTFAAKSFLSGCREGSVTMFHPGGYPHGVIGHARFLWRPVETPATEDRTLWLWVHAAVYEEVAQCLRAVFAAERGVSLAELKGQLNRFRTVGPLSQAVVAQAFEMLPVVADGDQRETWWGRLYRDPGQLGDWQRQAQCFGSLARHADPSHTPAATVLSIVAGDPRLNMPERRTKAVPQQSAVEECAWLEVDPAWCRSPLWDPTVRQAASQAKRTTAELNQLRAACIVPGQRLRSQADTARLPLLLVHRPGPRAGGWDLIAPSGWGLAVWRALVMRGARPAGLLAAEALSLETASLAETLQPDSRAGRAAAAAHQAELRARHFRLPPDKRPNYTKLTTPSPFSAPWVPLTRDWSRTDSCYVLRDRARLADVARLVAQPRNSPPLELRPGEHPALVPVFLECTGKGKPSEFAAICIPKEGDTNHHPPLEPVQVDGNGTKRRALRESRRKQLKAAKRKRKKEREEPRKGKGSGGEPDGHQAAMEELWLASAEPSTVVHAASRTILGYTVRGDFSFSKAAGCALGYVTLPGLAALLQGPSRNSSHTLVLLRDPDQLQYRTARLSVVTS